MDYRNLRYHQFKQRVQRRYGVDLDIIANGEINEYILSLILDADKWRRWYEETQQNT